MTVRKTKIKKPREMTVRFNPIRGVNDKLSPEAGGYAYAQIMENFDVSDGTLVPADGFDLLDEYVVPEGKMPRKCYLYKKYKTDGTPDHRLIVYFDDKYLYTCPFAGGTLTKISGVTFDSDPLGVLYKYNNQNVMIFAKSGGGLCIYNGSTVTNVPNAPEITSMCIHFERLFVTTAGAENALWFSDDFDPANWNVSLSEAGFIEMNDPAGELLKVVSFGDYLYVFRTYGITRISAYSDQRQFSATNLFLSSGKIFADSVMVCGDCIIFVATDGMYRFDGVSTQKISDAFYDRIDPDYPYCKGQYYNGYAYVRVKVGYNAAAAAEIIKLNPKTLEVTFLNGSMLSDFLTVDCDGKYKLYGATARFNQLCVLNQKDKLLYGAKLKMVWENGESDFGVPVQKTLKKLSFYSKADATAILFADGVKHTYKVKGSDKPVVLKPNLKGVRFKLRFEAREVTTRIASPELQLEYYL